MDDQGQDLDHSVRHWLARLRYGCEEAAASIVQRYWADVLCAARRTLGRAQPALADDEDVALGVFHDFFLGIRARKYHDIADAHNLGRLLAVMARLKARAATRRDRRYARRVMSGHLDQSRQPGNGPPDPAATVTADEQLSHLLEILGVDRLRSVASAKLLGSTNREIAIMLGCSERTIGRRLREIARIWSFIDPRAARKAPPGGGGVTARFDRDFLRRLS